MANTRKAIEDCDLWDVLDWRTVEQRSAEAHGDPRDPDADPFAWVARKLIDTDASGGALSFFKTVVDNFVGRGLPAVRRQNAGMLARELGADPERLIQFLRYKWGLFK